MSFDHSYFNDKLSKMTKEEYSEALSKGEEMNRPRTEKQELLSPTCARRKDQAISGLSDALGRILKKWVTAAHASSSSATKRIP